MKKLITLFAVLGLVLALALAADAAITGTGSFGNPSRSESGGDWTATGDWHALGGGTITVAGGSQVDMAGFTLTMGWSSEEKLTVTGTGPKRAPGHSDRHERRMV
jgi:opacity protein-like surface antigen